MVTTTPDDTTAVRIAQWQSTRTRQFEVRWFDRLALVGSGADWNDASRVLVFVDSTVADHWSAALDHWRNTSAAPLTIQRLDVSRRTKTLGGLEDVLLRIEAFKPNRRSEPIVAVGGGTLLDSVGLAAGLYRRGTPYHRVPSTLLAMVDVSIASKVAVDFEGRRNRIGLYNEPASVVICPEFLTSLPALEFLNGMGEILKIGLIQKRSLVDLARRIGNPNVDVISADDPNLRRLIVDSLQMMANELLGDPYERTLQRSVDFGHSFSPLIETRDDQLPHGLAVSLDCLFSCHLSRARDLMSQEQLDDVYRIWEGVGLPTWHPGFADHELLHESLADTVRHRDGNQNLPLPVGIGGHVFINDLTTDEIEAASHAMYHAATANQVPGA